MLNKPALDSAHDAFHAPASKPRSGSELGEPAAAASPPRAGCSARARPATRWLGRAGGGGRSVGRRAVAAADVVAADGPAAAGQTGAPGELVEGEMGIVASCPVLFENEYATKYVLTKRQQNDD